MKFERIISISKLNRIESRLTRKRAECYSLRKFGKN